MIQREHFTYRLQQLAPRDALVFRSIVGLLDSRTHVFWDHVDTENADLWVTSQADAPFETTRRGIRLVVGHAGLGTAPCTLSLSLPLRASEVFERLERVVHILKHEAVGNDRPMPRVRMLRWPSSQLLAQSPAYLKVATTLGNRLLPVPQLAVLARVAEVDCQAFIHLMVTAGYASFIEPATEEPATVKLQPRGLFARIRAHLGIESSLLGPMQ